MPCYALNRKFEVKLFFMRLPLLSVILFGGLFFSKAQEVLPTNIILIIGDEQALHKSPLECMPTETKPILRHSPPLV